MYVLNTDRKPASEVFVVGISSVHLQNVLVFLWNVGAILHNHNDPYQQLFTIWTIIHCHSWNLKYYIIVCVSYSC